MQFAIVHQTTYRYAAPAFATIQTLRLTPRAEPHQRVLRWNLKTAGALSAERDTYGNTAHMLTLHAPHTQLVIEAQGEVEVEALKDGRLDDISGVPPQAYLASSPLTEADAAVTDFARAHLTRVTPTGLMDFALAVFEAVRYTPGSTHVGTTAAQALAGGQGVCQDQAHLFIAGCRALGIPARYVSGYYYTTQASQAASHAWADAWLPEVGWISIDITHRQFASDALCRLAVGRDYDSACPVRGVRVGGGEESMQAVVRMRPFTLMAQGVTVE